jgi:hypothetical protein
MNQLTISQQKDAREVAQKRFFEVVQDLMSENNVSDFVEYNNFILEEWMTFQSEKADDDDFKMTDADLIQYVARVNRSHLFLMRLKEAFCRYEAAVKNSMIR